MSVCSPSMYIVWSFVTCTRCLCMCPFDLWFVYGTFYYSNFIIIRGRVFSPPIMSNTKLNSCTKITSCRTSTRRSCFYSINIDFFSWTSFSYPCYMMPSMIFKKDISRSTMSTISIWNTYSMCRCCIQTPSTDICSRCTMCMNWNMTARPIRIWSVYPKIYSKWTCTKRPICMIWSSKIIIGPVSNYTWCVSNEWFFCGMFWARNG